MRILIAFWLAALVVLTPAASAWQDEESYEAPICRKCKKEGRLPCGEHPKAECPLENEVLFCSAYMDCEECAGVGYVDCPKCEHEVAEDTLSKKRDELKLRSEGWKKLDEEMGFPLRKAESEHFLLVWEVDSMKVAKKRLNDHQLIHLYLRRLESMHELYTRTFGVTKADFLEKPRVFVWALPQDQLDGSLRFCRQGSRHGVRLLGSTPRYSVCGNKQFFSDDEKLHRNIVHSVTHLLFSNQKPSLWIGNLKGGWADEGLAHWFEEQLFGICTNYCYQEQNTNVDFKGGKFKVAIRKLVAMDKAPAVAEVFQQNTDTLTLPMHAACMSYVDFLIHTDSKKFNRLGRRLRQRVATRDAMKEIFGWNVLQFEVKWKEWVLATYPSR